MSNSINQLETERDPASLGARFIIAGLNNANGLASDASALLEARRYARALTRATSGMGG